MPKIKKGRFKGLPFYYNIFLIFILTIPNGFIEVFSHHKQQIKSDKDKSFDIKYKNHKQLSV